MTPDPTRRRVLQVTGAGATASIAGCTELRSNDGDELAADPEPDIDPEDGITAAVQPPEEELMALQQEVMAEVEAGELDQEDARAELRERENELYVSRSIEFESAIADADELSVEAAIGEHGAFLLTGSDERLVDLLRDDNVDALLPGTDYEEVLLAQEDAGPEPETDPDDDVDIEDPDSDDGADDDTDDAGDGDETDEETDDSSD